MKKKKLCVNLIYVLCIYHCIGGEGCVFGVGVSRPHVTGENDQSWPKLTKLTKVAQSYVKLHKYFTKLPTIAQFFLKSAKFAQNCQKILQNCPKINPNYIKLQKSAQSWFKIAKICAQLIKIVQTLIKVHVNLVQHCATQCCQFCRFSTTSPLVNFVDFCQLWLFSPVTWGLWVGVCEVLYDVCVGGGGVYVCVEGTVLTNSYTSQEFHSTRW